MNPLQLSQDRLEHLRHLEAHLCEQIRGQDYVISRVVPVLHRGELGLSTPGRPRGSFLFLGPTGVGKTELALAFTRYLFGNEKLFRFDMSEYQTQESLGLLLGGKLGEIGLLGLAVAKSSTGTLLFDEIEKAHPRVLDVFLQILDAARVTMANGETLDLSGFYIVFTSNLGGADILNLQHSSFATMERHVLARAQQSLRPELFARITEKLVFDRLSYDVQLAIAKLHIDRELAFLRGKGFNLTADESDRLIPHAARLPSSPRRSSACAMRSKSICAAQSPKRLSPKSARPRRNSSSAATNWWCGLFSDA